VGDAGVKAMAVLAGREERADISAQLDGLRAELERERLRADRAVAYGARLLLRLEALEQIVRDYDDPRLDYGAWAQEEIGTMRTLL
jgi:hypothetical protein